MEDQIVILKHKVGIFQFGTFGQMVLDTGDIFDVIITPEEFLVEGRSIKLMAEMLEINVFSVIPVVFYLGLRQKVVLLFVPDGGESGSDIIADVEVVQTDGGIREAFFGKTDVIVCPVTAQMLYTASVMVCEVFLEVMDEVFLVPERHNVQELSGLSVGQVGNESYPRGLFIESFLNL